MPQAKVIELDVQSFAPESISKTNASFQDVSGPLGARDILNVDRLENESSQPATAPLRRTVRIRLFEEVQNADGTTSDVSSGVSVQFTLNRRSTAAHRQLLITRIREALDHEDIKGSIVDPSWFY